MKRLQTSLDAANKKDIKDKAKKDEIVIGLANTLSKHGVVYKDGVYKTKSKEGYLIKQTYYLIPDEKIYVCLLQNDGYKTKKDLVEVNMDYNLRNRLDIRSRGKVLYSFSDGPSITNILTLLERKCR